MLYVATYIDALCISQVHRETPGFQKGHCFLGGISTSSAEKRSQHRQQRGGRHVTLEMLLEAELLKFFGGENLLFKGNEQIQFHTTIFPVKGQI